MPAQLTSVRRAARHDIARELAALTRRGRVQDWDEWDDWDEKGDRRAYPDAEIRQLVYWRTGSGPERWQVDTMSTRSWPTFSLRISTAISLITAGTRHSNR